MSAFQLRRLEHADMAAASVVHRTSFDAQFPWLAGLHTPDEDLAYWSGHLLPNSMLWGAEDSGGLAGVIAFRMGWIEQLYVLPNLQGQGIGSALLDKAKAGQGMLDLWTFQKNSRARRFYAAHGFTAVEETDGHDNEEREPDIRYRWSRQTG